MVGATGFEPDMAQVKVTFTTTENDLQLPESKRQLLVPAGTFCASIHDDAFCRMSTKKSTYN